MPNSNRIKNSLPTIINLFLVLFFAVATYLYFEGMNWFGYQFGKPVNNLNFFVQTAFLLVFDIGLMAYSFTHYKLKIRWPVIIAFLVFLVFALVPVLGFPGAIYEGEVVYTIGSELVIRYSLLTFMVFVSIFIFLFAVPNLLRNRKLYKLFVWIVIGVGLFATVYSYIFEVDSYIALLQNPHPYQNVPQSYTTNRNVYAYICIVAMMAEVYLLSENNWFLHWILLFYFFINAVFTFSKTCIILGFLILVASLARLVFRSWRKNKGLAITIVSIVVIGTVLVVLVSLIDFGGILGKAHVFTKFLFYELPKINDSSLGSRTYYFDIANEVLSHSTFTRMFGFGYGNWNAAYFASYSGDYTAYQPMDIAYAVDMFQFGYFGLAFSIVLWGFAIYLSIRQVIKRSKYAFANVLMLVCCLLRTVTEAGDFTHPNLTGTVYFLIILCPMIAENTQFLHIKTQETCAVFKKPDHSFSKVIAPILTSVLMVSSALLLCFSFRTEEIVSTLLFYSSIGLLVLSVLISMTIFVRAKKRSFILIINAVSSVALWLGAFMFLTVNISNLDGMTHSMVVLLAAALMFAINVSFVFGSLFEKEEKVEQLGEIKRSETAS